MCNTDFDVNIGKDMKTKALENKLRNTKRSMEITMLGTTLRDRKRSTWINE